MSPLRMRSISSSWKPPPIVAIAISSAWPTQT